jgi:hypothetical protein
MFRATVWTVLLWLAPGFLPAQSACRPADSTSAEVVGWVTGIVTGTDSVAVQQRQAMQLPSVSTSQISYVTDSRICSKMVAPYNANVGFQPPASGPGEAPSNQLHVVKVGTMYVVTDPALRAGAYHMFATIDKQYHVLWWGLG